MAAFMSCTEGVAKPGTRDVANTDKCTDDRVDVTDGNIKGGETKERKRRARKGRVRQSEGEGRESRLKGSRPVWGRGGATASCLRDRSRNIELRARATDDASRSHRGRLRISGRPACNPSIAHVVSARTA